MRARLLPLLALSLLTALFAAAPAEASHFRYGLLYWEPTGNPGQVEFTLEAAFRRSSFGGSGSDGRAVTGDIITETIGGTGLDFGDGSGGTGSLQFVVTAFSMADDFIIGRALNPGTTDPGVLHTYANTSTTYTAAVATCCRIGNLNNRNNGSYRIETPVTFDGNAPPVSALVPVVVVEEGAASSFFVPAADPNGDNLRWRVSTDAEAGGGPSPPNFSVNPNTGQVTWNTVGLNQTSFWTAQVVIEDLDGAGNVRSKTPVDFLLQVIPASANTPPVCAVSPSGPFSVDPGDPVGFTVTASDPDPGATVTLNTGGLPTGATMVPALPLSGPSPTNSVFDWTPTASQSGIYTVVFQVEDNVGSQVLCSAEIAVTEPGLLVVSPDSLDFGTVVVGATSPAQSATLRNTGGLDLTVTSVLSTAPPYFEVTSAPSTPFVIAPGDSATVEVAFSPDFPGSFPALLQVTSDGGNADVALSGSGFALGGPVVGWGNDGHGQATPPPGLTGVTAVAAGNYHSLAVKGDGTVAAWGLNDVGQTNVPAGLSGVTAVDAGYSHNLALKGDGTVAAWGRNADGEATVPAGLSGVVAVSAGGHSSFALLSDGTIVAWGNNSQGQLNVPAGLTGVVAIAAGGGHVLALKSDGTVVGWGYNNNGEADPPAGLTGVVAIAGGGNHSLALKSDGTVVAWGWNAFGQTDVPAGLSGVTAIAAAGGGVHNLALKGDSTVVAWGGSNLDGELSVPFGLAGVLAVAAGNVHSLALLETPDPGELIASPVSVIFGAIAVGETSPPQSVTLSNTGGSDLTVSAITLGSSNPEQFDIANAPALPLTLGPGETVFVDVVFAPDSASVFHAELQVVSDVGSGFSSLTGTGLTPGMLAVAPDSLDFGAVEAGQTSAPQTVFVSNVGQTALFVASVASSLPAAFEVTSAPSTPFVIAPGDSVTVQVVFSPDFAGTFAALLQITSDGGNADVALNGTGLTPGMLAAAPDSLGFGSVPDGQTSPPQTATLTNTGQVALTVSALSLTGDDAGQFEIAGAPATPFVLAPGNSATVAVSFAPTAVGSFAAALLAQSDDGDASVVLTGTGIVPPPSLTVTLRPDDPPVVVGPDTSFSFTGRVTNETAAPLQQQAWLVLTKPDGASVVQFGPVTVRLRPGRSVEREFTVLLAGAAPGTYTYTGYVGAFPNDATDSDSFTFEVTGDALTRAVPGGARSALPASLPALRLDGDAAEVWGETDDAVWAALVGGTEAAAEATAEAAQASAVTALPAEVALAPPYPNPSSGRATLRYGLPEASSVRLAVYDLLGREVAVLADGEQAAGYHEAALDAGRLPSGLYLVRLEAGGRALTQRMTVVR